MSDARLSPDELATLMAARPRVRRAEVELRWAQADLDLTLLNLQEAHRIGPGDKLTPDGAILRAERPIEHERVALAPAMTNGG